MGNTNLKSEVSKLFNLEKKKVFKVPDGFFQKLEKDILNGRRGKSDKTRKIMQWMELSAAAAILGFLLFSGLKVISEKEYVPIETDRTMYNITDGDMDGEPIVNANN